MSSTHKDKYACVEHLHDIPIIWKCILICRSKYIFKKRSYHDLRSACCCLSKLQNFLKRVAEIKENKHKELMRGKGERDTQELRISVYNLYPHATFNLLLFFYYVYDTNDPYQIETYSNKPTPPICKSKYIIKKLSYHLQAAVSASCRIF